ncbi:MAG TPA: hypothetical protein VMT18_13670 [Planctomycetota bacterium]|nr:hypothetical protein [Planctomycetota bacterium]
MDHWNGLQSRAQIARTRLLLDHSQKRFGIDRRLLPEAHQTPCWSWRFEAGREGVDAARFEPLDRVACVVELDARSYENPQDLSRGIEDRSSAHASGDQRARDRFQDQRIPWPLGRTKDAGDQRAGTQALAIVEDAAADASVVAQAGTLGKAQDDDKLADLGSASRQGQASEWGGTHGLQDRPVP